MTRNTEAASSAARTPIIAQAIATLFGLGFIPLAPGTWGSAVGAALFWAVGAGFGARFANLHAGRPFWATALFPAQLIVAALIAILGVWCAGLTERGAGKPDPGFVIIDEVSGQHLTFLIGLAALPKAPNWKYFLLGFILFRVFDIWKPFPARHAESLSGGWGIMADDWVAGIYAGAGLLVATALGL